MTLADAKAAFATTGGYLAACSIGLPCSATATAMADDLQAWRHGGVTPADYSRIVETVRAAFAELVSVPPGNVAIGSQTSVLASLVAGSIPDGAEVLCPMGDFSSMVYPFLAQADRGVTVRHVPIAALAASITAHTHLVAFSAVQSGTGEVARLDDIIQSAHSHGVRTFCDTTQAAGWLPIDAGRFDATVCHAYKWLCAPRGVAFLTLTDEFADTLTPAQAGWYAGESVWDSLYGPEMRLAGSARRFDVSPSWPSWVGAAPALDLFRRLDPGEIERHDVELGNELCRRLGMEPQNQAIVTWPEETPGTVARAAADGVVISCNAGRLRAAFHVWNDFEDVDRLVTTLRPHGDRRS